MAKLQTINGVKEHKVVSRKVWLTARKSLLVKEKKFTRLRDQLNQQRRSLPWVKVDKEYVFDGPNGQETLADLFGDQHQLIVYHFMMGPGWEEGCPHCSFWADHFDGVSAFYKDPRGDIYHTYSAYARGIDLMNTTYNFLDLTAKGRDENPDRPQDWVRHHDQYPR
jgi:predicted dithiol-disulfide oxidoreductase (DUF899 family)